MGLDVVLNEVSLIDAAHSISQANQLMSDLFETISATNLIAGRGNTKIEICTPKDLLGFSLAPDYPMRRWLNDRTVDERQRRLFLAIATKEPYIDNVTESYEEEFFYQEKPVKSLGYAYQKEALAVSLLSDPCWNFSYLTLERHLLDTSEAIIIEDQVTVAHASSKAHVQKHAQWIRTLLQAEISDGSILWERREELFPSLQFCADVEAQLLGIAHGNVVLRQILSKLSLLEQHCKDWDDGPFEPQKLASKATPESQATLNQYGNERTFLCPDGQLLTFSWHVRLTPHAWRIHFFPLEERRQLIIGYIGPHLPTVKHH